MMQSEMDNMHKRIHIASNTDFWGLLPIHHILIF